MCGLVGFIGSTPCIEPILKALSRLEYRGYDSSGIAVINHNQVIERACEIGELDQLIEKLNGLSLHGNVGIGHTRWATHGKISRENCHPHLDCSKNIAVVHNGIIENFHALKKKVDFAHQFSSQTDTEVIAHLLESLLKEFTLKDALIALVNQLQGTFALAILLRSFPDRLIAIRKRSPICIGIGEDANCIASDQIAFADKANQMIIMPDESFAFVYDNKVELFDFEGVNLVPDLKPIQIKTYEYGKNGFAHFMLKEIYEQKTVIQHIVEQQHKIETIFEQMGLKEKNVKDLSSITIIACGTSYHAGLLAKIFFEEIAHIKTNVQLASEFRYGRFWVDPGEIYLGISQSGETIDTLEALKISRDAGGYTIALTNCPTSTMVQETDGYIEIFAGPEVAVASTKAFSAQMVTLYLIAYHLGIKRELIAQQKISEVYEDLLIAAQILEDSIECYKENIKNSYAPFYAQFQKMLFIGRQESYVIAQEAALKVKEISYIFADALPAGELKHGSIALIDATTPVVLFSSLRPIIYQKLLATAQEIKARESHLLVFAFEGQEELIDLADYAFILPQVCPLLGPLVQTGLMHYFAYQIALKLDRPIDKPRNLAKSVTVE